MLQKNLKRKIAAVAATSALLLGAMVPSAFADSVHVSGNGARSDNNVSVRHNHSVSVNQRNDSNISNNVRINSDTGNNRSSFNTGGDNVIVTGNSRNHVGISNNAGFNFANIGGGHSWNGSSHGNNWHMNHGKKLHTMLSGSQEVPGPGDSNGFGNAQVRLHPSKGELCVQMHVKNIDPATAAHIHEAPAGQAGPVVVNLPTPNADGHVNGCVAVAEELLREIKEDPSDYYINVHNTAFPDGAVRGQL